jgi:hypothetical protein
MSGTHIGHVELVPPVYTDISFPASRTAAMGRDRSGWFSPPQDDYEACKKIRKYETIELDMQELAGEEVIIRLYQSILVRNKYPGNAYWKSIEINRLSKYPLVILYIVAGEWFNHFLKPGHIAFR